MPRQRSVGRAPSRPTASSSSSSSPAQQQRPATTMAAPQQHQQYAPPPPAAAPQQVVSQGPGLFGQMASTAAGVAIGSSIGHAIGGLFSGGSSEPAAPVQAQAAPQQQQAQTQYGNNNCAGAAQTFTKCLDDNQGNMQICNWYLEQLKACQAAASQY